jgi:hypothetical protein
LVCFIKAIFRQKPVTGTGYSLFRHGFADFIRFQTGAANLYTFDGTFNNGTNFVQVRIETSLGGIQSMTAMIAYLSGFSTDIAYS